MIKAAVIGCGRMGAAPADRLAQTAPAGWLPISHAACLRQTPGVELAALCDSDAGALERAGREHGVTALYTDYRQMLREVRPALVGVATRTPAKGNVIAAAGEHGVRGLYVEKPLANSLRDCREALELAARCGMKIAYGVNRRHHAAYREARRLVADGAIGELQEITVEHGFAQLLWAHPHSTDLILQFAGAARPLTVQAALQESSVERVAIDRIDSDPRIAHAHFTFDGGITATIGRVGGLNLRVGGTTGNLTVLADGTTLQLERESAPGTGYFKDLETRLTGPVRGGTLVAFAELLAAMRGEGPGPIAPQEILSGSRMLFGCVWSHLEGGRRIELAAVPESLVVTGRSGNAFA